MWYGVGGQGKSALLREFGRMATSFNEAEKERNTGRKLIPAKIDFDDERLKRIDSALYSIRLQLAQTSDFSFHTFDTAFIAYYKKTRPGIDIATAFPELFKGEKEGMMDLLDVLDGPLTLVTDLASAALPGANLLYKWGARLTGKLASWWKSRGNAVLAGIEHLHPEQLLERLPSYLGIDICDGIKSKPNHRPVVLLDTYEALWRGRGQKDGLADRRTDVWVRLLVQDAPGVLFVIAGRDKLRWGEIDEAWNSVVNTHLLGGLAEEDADHFLLQVPIDQPDIRAKIVSSSNGLPFYLDLQVSQYEAIRERQQTPMAEQFGGTPSDILARFLDHLSDADQSTLRLASYLQTITRTLMDSLAEAFPGRAINYSFDQMVSRSSFTETSEGTYEIHALMKEELQRREKTENEEKFKKVHHHLHGTYKVNLIKLTDNEKWDHSISIFVTTFFHALQADPALAIKWFMEERIFLEDRHAWVSLVGIYEDCINALNSIGIEGTIGAVLMNNLAVVQDNLGNTQEAEALLTKVLDFSGLDDSSRGQIKAAVLNNMAHIHLLRGERNQALDLLEDAFMIAKKIETLDQENLAKIAAATAEIRFLDGDFDSALPLFFEAATSLAKHGSLNGLSTILSLISENFHALGRFGIAVNLMQKVPSLYELERDNIQRGEAPPITDALSFFTDDKGAAYSAYQWRTNLTDNFWSNTRFRFLSKIFNSEKIALRDQSKLNTESSRKIIDFLRSDEKNYNSLELYIHKNSNIFLHELRSHFDRTEIGKIFLDVIDHLNMGPVFFEGESDGVEVIFFERPPRIGVVVKRDAHHLPPHQFLQILFQMRVADHVLGGGRPPDINLGVMEHAGYYHARNLDSLYYVAEFINQSDQITRSKYIDVLNEDMIEFISLQYSKASKEELYDQYAKIFD